jgi:beta-glucosidase
MCSYNAINGDYACENKYTLTDVLRKDWHFKGFVVSDWGGTHSTIKASAAGLDNEEPAKTSTAKTSRKPSGRQDLAGELDEHVRRILRSEFAAGLVDDPIRKSVVDVEGGLETAQHRRTASFCSRTPTTCCHSTRTRLKSIAIIGDHADMGMISGGGSAQVDPPGAGEPPWLEHVWFPTSPLKSVIAKAPTAKVEFASAKIQLRQPRLQPSRM